MARFGFCGGFYTSQSVNADCQLCMNLYPESDESGLGKSATVLYASPGLKVFATLANVRKIRGVFQITVGSVGQRMFAVGDSTLVEIHNDGTYTPLGQVGNDGLPVSWGCNNANQLIVCSGGNLWCYPLIEGLTRNVADTTVDVATMQEAGTVHGASVFVNLTVACPFAVGADVTFAGCTGDFSFLNGQTYPVATVGLGYPGYGTPSPNTFTINLAGGGNSGVISQSAATVLGPGNIPFTELTQVNVFAGPFAAVRFMDGVFITFTQNSQDFALSNLEDGTNWDPTDVAQVEEFPDNIVAMEVNDEILWFFGPTRIIPYQDSGNALFPYTPIEGVLIEGGIGPAASLTKLDNALFWISQDERGQGIGWRMNGYTPTRISTHAIEYAWSQYSTISDAVGYPYQDQGHTFWRICFPTAQATWQYDVATGLWSQCDRWVNGESLAHPSWVHCFCFGKHLVGDPFSGNIYDMNIDYLDNEYPGGVHQAIRRVRRAPHVSVEQQYVRYRELQIYLEAGLGQPTTAGIPTGFPFITLQDSSGQWWECSVDDNGILRSETTVAGTGETFILSRADGTYWLLGAQVGTGRLTTTEVQNYGPAFPVINFISPHQLQFGLIVLATNQLETFQVPLSGEPQMVLRWSDDGGHTWSNDHFLDCGKVGEFKRRAIQRAMGRARDRVFEISMTGAQPWRIIDAYLKATPAFQPAERLNSQLSKIQ